MLLWRHLTARISFSFYHTTIFSGFDYSIFEFHDLNEYARLSILLEYDHGHTIL